MTPWETCRNSVVVEIGPGKGALTQVLARRAHRLIAVELDRMMSTELRFKYRLQPQVEIIEADVLKLDFRTVLNRTIGPLNDLRPLKPSRARVVGNLPYYITSDILLRLFEFHEQFDVIVIMVQREVADRIAARPGTRDYGMLSATAQLYTKVENLFTLPPSAFSPPPKVHSSVLRLTVAPRFAELQVNAGGVHRIPENGICHEAQDAAQQLEKRLSRRNHPQQPERSGRTRRCSGRSAAAGNHGADFPQTEELTTKDTKKHKGRADARQALVTRIRCKFIKCSVLVN